MRSAASRWMLPAVALFGLTALLLTITVVNRQRGGAEVADAGCRSLRVVTAASFAPVLSAVAPRLADDDPCVRLQVEVADGRSGAQRVREVEADLWIPDDGAWVGSAGNYAFAEAPTAAAGAVLATSPVYMVTDRRTGGRLAAAGGTWLGLSELLTTTDDTRLVVRDPASSGDGLVAAGGLAESVWQAQDMDASALWLSKALRVTRTVTDRRPALPTRPGEVGLVPEHALLPQLARLPEGTVVAAGRDQTVQLRYTWLPSAAAVSNPTRAAALERVRRELTGPDAAALLAAARLRAPGAATAPGGSDKLPTLTAKPLGVLGGHHADHVFTAWYPADRRTNVLVVVDVSGSMSQPAPGTDIALINLVRDGCRTLADLLPDDARLGLWEFGSELDGERDHREVLAPGPLQPQHRAAVANATGQLRARRTGTGLHDTILTAYQAARDAYQPGVSNQVLVFTDGRDEDDADAISAAELTAELAAAQDPARPVQLSVAAFGDRPEAEQLTEALKVVDGYVDRVGTAADVEAIFIHTAAGGLHH